MQIKHTHEETYATHECVSATAYVIIFSTKRPVFFEMLGEDGSYGHLQITCIANPHKSDSQKLQNFFEEIKKQVLRMFAIDTGLSLPYRDEISSLESVIHVNVNIEMFETSSDLEVTMHPFYKEKESSVHETLKESSRKFFEEGGNVDKVRFRPDPDSG